MNNYKIILFCLLAAVSCKTKHGAMESYKNVFSIKEYLYEYYKDTSKYNIIKIQTINNQTDSFAISYNTWMQDSLLYTDAEASKIAYDQFFEKSVEQLNNPTLKKVTFHSHNNKLALKSIIAYYEGSKIKCLSKPLFVYSYYKIKNVLYNTQITWFLSEQKHQIFKKQQMLIGKNINVEITYKFTPKQLHL